MIEPNYLREAIDLRWAPFPPVPFPDETIGSIAARYHLHSCNFSQAKSRIELFGSSRITPNCSLPGHLLHFMAVVSGKTDLTALQQLSANHTLLPYHSFFSTDSQRAAAFKSMAGDGPVKSQLGLLASRFGGADELRFCKKCVELDIEKHGVAYWHRVHQLPLVRVCRDHGNPLFCYCISSLQRQRHVLVLPPPAHSKMFPIIQTPQHLMPRAQRFAQLSSSLLSANQEKVRFRRIYPAYLERIFLRNLANEHGRIHQTALAQQLREHHADFAFLGQLPASLLMADEALPWLACLLQRHDRRHHPVTNLLLIDFLFHDFDDFFDQVTKISQSDSIESVSEVVTTAQLCRQLLSVQTSSLLGTASETSIGSKDNGAIPLPPRYLTDAMHKALLQDLAQGKSIPAISQRFQTSDVSVYRILRMHPAVKAQRVKSIGHAERKSRRERFIGAITSANQANARSAAPRDYMWLWRNDKRWLDSVLKHRASGVIKKTKKIDWAARDFSLARQLQAVANDVRYLPGRPVRITIKELGRRVNRISWLEKFRAKLPIVSSLLETLIETTEQYQARRIQWAVAELTKQGKNVTRTAVQRLAGIGDRSSESIMVRINAYVDEAFIPKELAHAVL